MTKKIYEQKKNTSSCNPISSNFGKRRLKLKKIKRSLFYRWYMKNIYNFENKSKYPNINLNQYNNIIYDPNKEKRNLSIENRDEDRVEIRQKISINGNNLKNFANSEDKNKIEFELKGSDINRLMASSEPLRNSFLPKNPFPNTPVKFWELKSDNDFISFNDVNNNAEFIDNEIPFSLLNNSTSPYHIGKDTSFFLSPPTVSNLGNYNINPHNKFSNGFTLINKRIPPIICSCRNSLINNINADRDSNRINSDISNNNNIFVGRNSGNNNRNNERNTNNNNSVNNNDISFRSVNENNIINNRDINNGNTNNLGNHNNNNTHNINSNLNQNNSRNSTFIEPVVIERRRRRSRRRARIKEIKNKLLTKKIIVKDISKLDENKNSCVICLEKFKNHQKVYKLDCTHIFHIKCLNKEIKFRQKCPCCRKYL